jgi:hypothetical protein
MTVAEREQLIVDLVAENDDYRIKDYLKVLAEIEGISAPEKIVKPD